MTDTLLKGLAPMHPGELLREDVLPALGQSKAAIARALGVSRMTLYDILRERQPITAAMALRIGRLTATSAESWLRLQNSYDLRTLSERLEHELNQIPRMAA